MLESPELDWLNLIGRLEPGANTKKMEAQLQVELRQFLLSPPSKVEKRDAGLIPKQTLHLSPGGRGVRRMQENYKDGLHLLMWTSEDHTTPSGCRIIFEQFIVLREILRPAVSASQSAI